MKKSAGLPFELIVWTIGLLALAISDFPASCVGFCPFKWLGFAWCPGCGLGRSISYLLHGNLNLSFQTHPLGGAALIILASRILKLGSSYFQNTFEHSYKP